MAQHAAGNLYEKHGDKCKARLLDTAYLRKERQNDLVRASIYTPEHRSKYKRNHYIFIQFCFCLENIIQNTWYFQPLNIQNMSLVVAGKEVGPIAFGLMGE